MYLYIHNKYTQNTHIYYAKKYILNAINCLIALLKRENIVLFENVIYSCDANLNFKQSLSQSSVSHDPQKSFYYANLLLKKLNNQFLIINVENSCAAEYFCGNPDNFFRII